jgi:hypothetical protein
VLICFIVGSVEGSRSLFLSFYLFSCSYVYSRSLTTTLVIYNLYYVGSLIAMSCNLLFLIKNMIYSSVAKKCKLRSLVWFVRSL